MFWFHADMDVAALIESLAEDGDRLAAAADRAGWDAPVPGTDWDVRALVTHIGGVHRWAADIVDTASPTGATVAGKAVGSGPPDAELLEWYQNGHAALVQTLRDAPADLECFTFLPAESALHFWARRQAHETAIHRADAEAAAGDVTPFDASFAQDGIAELLGGFARRRSNAPQLTARIGLDAADGPSWLVSFGGERIEAVRGAELVDTDVTVRGLSSDIYLWLWNRPTDAVVEGDEQVAGVWSSSVRVTWS
jgi:uncharacterized protein (TIGR03083 family)